MLGGDYTHVGEEPPLRSVGGPQLRCHPSCIAVNSLIGEVALADPKGRQYIILAVSRNFAIAHMCNQGWGGPHTRFKRPSGVAYSSEGDLAICDELTHYVQIFKNHGRDWLCAFGGSGRATEQLNQPKAVAWVNKAQVAVLDTGNRRVQVFTREGALVTSTEGTSAWSGPVDLAVWLNNGPTHSEQSLPSWLRKRDVLRHAAIDELSTQYDRGFMVVQHADEEFEVLIKKYRGPVRSTDRLEKWLDYHTVLYEDGVFSEQKEEGGNSACIVEAVRQRQMAREKDVKAANAAPETETKPPTDFPTLADAIKYVATQHDCPWPLDARRRNILAVLDSHTTRIYMYGYIASQTLGTRSGSSDNGGGHIPLTPPACYTMGYVDCGLLNPSSLCFDMLGTIVVADTGNRRVVAVRPHGPVLREFHVTKVATAQGDPAAAISPSGRAHGTPTLIACSEYTGGTAAELKGSLLVIADGELHIYKGPKYNNMGTLHGMEMHIFKRTCDWLCYTNGAALARTCKTMLRLMRELRTEWRLYPLTPRALLNIQQLFVDWCRLPSGDKFKIAEPRDTINNGRRVICRHWLKDGLCPYGRFSCLKPLYVPLGEELRAQHALMEFDHGLYCALCQVYGLKFWHEYEHVLQRVFDMLANDFRISSRTQRSTGNFNDIAEHYSTVKALDFVSFQKFMLMVVEHQASLRPFHRIPMLQGVDVISLRRMGSGTLYDKLKTLQGYQAVKCRAVVDSVLA